MKYFIALFLTTIVGFVQAQTVNLIPTITELRVTRSDTGETVVFNSFLAPEYLSPLVPRNFDSAVAKAKSWATECKCRVYLRDSLYYDGKLSSSSSSVYSSKSSSSVVSVRSSSSQSSLLANSSSLSSSSVGQVPIVRGILPTQREDGSALSLSEISHLELHYDVDNYDILPVTSSSPLVFEYPTNYPSTGQWYMVTVDTDNQVSDTINVVM